MTLSRTALKEALTQALFDTLDEMEGDPNWTTLSTEKEAEVLADAVFQVITETNDEDLGIDFPEPEEYNEEDVAE